MKKKLEKRLKKNHVSRKKDEIEKANQGEIDRAMKYDVDAFYTAIQFTDMDLELRAAILSGAQIETERGVARDAAVIAALKLCGFEPYAPDGVLSLWPNDARTLVEFYHQHVETVAMERAQLGVPWVPSDNPRALKYDARMDLLGAQRKRAPGAES